MNTLPEPDSDKLPPRWQAIVRWGVPMLTLAALLWIGFNCFFNPKISFLPPGPGKWIVFPLRARLESYPGIRLDATFRRGFLLQGKPASALLSWRCMNRGQVSVNNTILATPDSSSGNWKKTSHADIGPYLHAGSNEISVTVANQPGPPALTLELKAENVVVESDETWEVSISGSDWRLAQAASTTLRPAGGDEMASFETVGGALLRSWPWLCLFVAISGSIVALWRYFPGRSTIILGLIAAAWVLLFLHNLPVMPAGSGFDARDHLAYVRYIQDYHMLPAAWEGWEMFQPPLYYVVSAVLLGLCHLRVFEPAGMMALRFLSLAIGLATLALVYAGLRLVFPGDRKKPLAGLVLAAFLPAQLYLLHYTTNETLSAMFATVALCLALYLLRGGRRRWGWYGVLGVVLGLALSSKASAVPVVLLVLGALSVKLIRDHERSFRVWLGNIVSPLAICLAIGGWHYLKLWHEYGNPLAGNWDSKVADGWWQARGFQTSGYYFSFGDSLTRPFFSGLHSFWDGLYSTLWGDGLLGGKLDPWNRAPWNYDLMAVGYVLALIPTILVLTGMVRAAARCFRSANLSWLLLLGIGWVFAFAILDMSCKVPSYAQTKAFYGLPALLPFCALGALGFEFWADRGKAACYVLCTALGIWLINVYASFWIMPHTLQSELSVALGGLNLETEPSKAFINVLDHHPDSIQAALWLALLEAKKDPRLAVQRLEHAAKVNPANARLESSLAEDLGYSGQLDEAAVHAKRAVELAPDDAAGYQTLCLLELRRKRYEDSVAAARRALSLNPSDLLTRFNLGAALMNLRQIPEATGQFQALVDFKPAWAEAQYCLGRCLLGQPGKQDEAVAHLQEAVRLNPSDAQWQATLQNAVQSH